MKTILIILISILLFLVVIVLLGYLFLFNPIAPKVNKKLKHITFIGDSITYGYGVMPFVKKYRYTTLIQKKLHNYQVLNYGLSSRTLLSLGDHPYIKEKFFNLSKNVKSDFIFIMLGTNDSKPYNWKGKEQYKAEYLSFIDEYKIKSKDAIFFLCLCPKAHKNKRANKILFDINDEVILNEIIPTIKEISAISKTELIDFYSLTKDHPEYFRDGVHPNKLGNKIMAEYLYSILEKFL